MKSLFAIIVASFLVIGSGKAQQLNDVVVPSQAFDTLSTNYVFTAFTNATLATVVTIQASPSLYHTVQIYPTNVYTYVVDRTIDGTNWFCGATNAAGAAFISEATITGKYNQLRVRVQGTNLGGGISYLGGR